MLMRRILCDLARSRKRTKRGGAMSMITLEPHQEVSAKVDFEELNQALEALAEKDPRAVQVVEIKFFGGLTVAEIAQVLEVSEATVNREWRMARTWLFQALNQGGDP